MTKNKLIKNITIDDLAKIIKKGFDRTASKEQFENLEKDIRAIRQQLTGVILR